MGGQIDFDAMETIVRQLGGCWDNANRNQVARLFKQFVHDRDGNVKELTQRDPIKLIISDLGE